MHSTTKLDLKVMVGAGAGLLALAGMFLWRDLQVPSEALVAIGAVGAAILALAKWPKERPLAGPIALIAMTAIGGIWFAARKEPLMLPALGVCMAASGVTVLRMNELARDANDRLHLLLLWHGFAFATLVTTAAFYFQFLTLGIAQDDIARRIVLTLFWLVTGLGLVLMARSRQQAVIRDAGFVFLGVAVAKAMLYDTVELSGSLRVGGLAAAGLLLMLGAWVASRLSPLPAPAPKPPKAPRPPQSVVRPQGSAPAQGAPRVQNAAAPTQRSNHTAPAGNAGVTSDPIGQAQSAADHQSGASHERTEQDANPTIRGAFGSAS